MVSEDNEKNREDSVGKDSDSAVGVLKVLYHFLPEKRYLEFSFIFDNKLHREQTALHEISEEQVEGGWSSNGRRHRELYLCRGQISLINCFPGSILIPPISPYCSHRLCTEFSERLYRS